MKTKAFFQSTAFKSVAVLLSIVLLSGLLLAVCNDLLYVSSEERLNRTLSKIYGGSVEATEIEIGEDDGTNVYGTVNSAYLVEDGNYLIQTTGTGGYPKGTGTVTLWTVFSCTGSAGNGDLVWTGIEKVVYESNTNQTFISKISQSMYDEFTQHDAEVLLGALFTTSASSSDITNLTANASFSSAAICNAVNCAIVYFKAAILKSEQSAYAYADYVDLNASSAQTEGDAVFYALTVKGNSPAGAFLVNVTVQNGKITAYEIAENGSTADRYVQNMPQEVKDGSAFLGKTAEEIEALLTEGKLSETSGLLETGATRSTESCVRAAAFAASNYQTVLEEGGLK